jgi:hypothetical protein
MQLNFNINSQAITDMAKALNSDRYTAMARIAAEDMNITELEIPTYMKIFHQNMNDRKGVLESIRQALKAVILNPITENEAAVISMAPNPDPLQSAYYYSLN